MSSTIKAPYDVIIVGAGPNGLSCAIEAQARGLQYLVVDRGTIAESIRRFPTNMTFFSTPELLELGNLPFTSPSLRPSRQEALVYYRRVVQHFGLSLRLHCEITKATKNSETFELETGRGENLHCTNLIIATGYFDTPNIMGISGENLSHVSHYYHEPFKYFGSKVAVVGAENSAVDAALELYRHGAEVTLIHRGTDIGPSVKYWVRPDIVNRIKEGSIRALYSTEVQEITSDALLLKNIKSCETFKTSCDFVFLLTGYRPDTGLLNQLSIQINPVTIIPHYNPKTHETNTQNVYLAGSIVCGCETGNVFIENGRHHASAIMNALSRPSQSS